MNPDRPRHKGLMKDGGSPLAEWRGMIRSMAKVDDSYQEQPSARMPAGWLWTCVGGGVLIGMIIVTNRGTWSDAGFQVWASLAVALTGAAGGVFAYGCLRRREVHRRWSVRVRLTARALLWWWLLVAFWIAAALLPVVRGDHVARGAALVATAMIGASPLVLAMHGLRLAADADLHRATAEWLYDTPELAARVRGLLIAGGALVALATLALGASRGLPGNAVTEGGTPATPETVVVFGAMGSVVVGLIYIPAYSALRERAMRVMAQFLPLPASTDVPTLLELSERRAALLNFLSVDVEATGALRNNVWILSPLLSAAAALFLPTH